MIPTGPSQQVHHFFNMSSADIQARIGPVLVNYAENGTFPGEESVAAAHIEDTILPDALDVLNMAKTELEAEVRQISRQNLPDVEAWMVNARAVHEDLERLRRLATDIVREAEDDEDRLELLQDRETHMQLLEREALFNKRLSEALLCIHQVNDALDQTEGVAGKKNILKALRLLAETWEMIDKLPVTRTRAARLLDDRCFDLRLYIHEQLSSIWQNLIHWNKEDKKILTINVTIEGVGTSLDEAITSWKAFRELDTVAKQLWEDLDNFILKPRTDIQHRALSSISILENTLSVSETEPGKSIKSLMEDLELVVQFLLQNLPNELVKCLSKIMMPIIFARVKEQWLDPAVPSSMEGVGEYQQSLAQVNAFAATLDSLNWPATEGFYDWVSNAHKIWLSKRKETALDWTRNQLALGVGTPTIAHHFEKQMVAENKDIQGPAQTGSTEVVDWDAGWESDGKDGPEAETPTKINPAPVDEECAVSDTQKSQTNPSLNDDDDAADAWGWGDDELTDEPISDPRPIEDVQPSTQPEQRSEMREVTLSEPYWISTAPKLVFDIIMAIYDDGAELMKPENEATPVSAAAAGLFSIPTQILAMYRAVSPYYYSRDASGNMYTYNDTIWLCDKFREFISAWDSRHDLSPRTHGFIKLNTEIEKLASFGKRAYANELTSQRTVINDFLGGGQNFLESSRREELEQGIDTVITHIKNTSEAWKNVLSYSAWASAVGSLVNTVAKKIISDVFDRDDLGADEANLIAELIVKVTALDDLFIPDSQSVQSSGGKNGTESVDNASMDLGTAPLTARFADKWLKMQYLGEVLQSNLANIRFLWFESSLSLEFTKEEVVDLILLSFENNPQVRGLIKEIKDSEVKEMDEQW